jgi:hypothetical protein
MQIVCIQAGKSNVLLYGIQIGREAVYQGPKQLGREANHSHPSRTEVKNNGITPPLLLIFQRYN